MSYLVDTNVLVCEAVITNPYHSLINEISEKLDRIGQTLHITSQNLVEFRNVATRDISKNGFGLTASDVDKETQRLKRVFPLLIETTLIFPAWETIV